MRLFIAVLFDEPVLDALAGAQQAMKAQGVSGNFTKRENLHLTLAFIGEYGNPQDVLDVLEQIPFRPFSIRLNGAGCYGDLFWAGIEEQEELRKLVKRIRRALSDQGIPFDRKRFSPHITLVRKAAGRDGQRVSAPEIPEAAMNVAGISLMRSERGRHGMVYTEIGRIG